MSLESLLFIIIREIQMRLRVNLGNIENQEIKQHRIPKFQSTFKPVAKVNFDLSSIKPGLPSEKLCEALGMKSSKKLLLTFQV